LTKKRKRAGGDRKQKRPVKERGSKVEKKNQIPRESPQNQRNNDQLNKGGLRKRRWGSIADGWGEDEAEGGERKRLWNCMLGLVN